MVFELDSSQNQTINLDVDELESAKQWWSSTKTSRETCDIMMYFKKIKWIHNIDKTEYNGWKKQNKFTEL